MWCKGTNKNNNANMTHEDISYNRIANENGLKAQQAHSPGQSEAAPRDIMNRTPPAP